MKNLILLLLIIIGFSAKSQIIVNGVDVETQKPNYINVYALAGKLFDNKIVIGVNYGQLVTSIQKEVLENTDGKPIEFNGITEMLNYFYKNGYEFEDTFFQSNSESARTIFLLKQIQ